MENIVAMASKDKYVRFEQTVPFPGYKNEKVWQHISLSLSLLSLSHLSHSVSLLCCFVGEIMGFLYLMCLDTLCAYIVCLDTFCAYIVCLDTLCAWIQYVPRYIMC